MGVEKKDLVQLKKHGAVWRFLEGSGGYLVVLCWVDDKHEDVPVLEYEDINIAYQAEQSLTSEVVFSNSINDLLEDRKRYYEQFWNGGGNRLSRIWWLSLSGIGGPSTAS